ncbi:peptidase M3 [Erysipelothrix larvae]|uniref:Peptidase M3 n=1 Tax=Erysipelothrix larvae TaxID=1514105 RepID=A0A0X8H1D9_9FIRM|nr:M3 family oligoendopeptidase [Erysipelothrix larvae]AMC94286.1 peptidase M3 [Erysipelothrix larvae]
MYTWSLDELYRAYDETFDADIELIESKIEALDALSQDLKDCDSLVSWLETLSDLETLGGRIASFVHLNMATNTTDTQSAGYAGKISLIFSKLSAPTARFKTWFISQKDHFDEWASTHELVNEHRFILQEIIDKAAYNLSEDVENAISLMNINAASAWSTLQSHLTSVTTIEKEGETYTLSSIRNLAYDEDSETRKKAYQTELELYPKIEDSVAFALNSIKGQVNLTSDLRGYDSPIQKTLFDSRMSQKTLDALLNSIESYFGEFRRYLKHKATLLGHENGLPWYDLFAPYKLENPKTYSVEDSHKIIVESFADFSEDLSHMADRAYKENWIDFLPRKGKRDGAFCSNLSFIKQSRVLTNYGGTMSDIVTIAHELGHAYHGMMIEDNAILNTDYTMPVAETASTFCENIVLNAALKTASDEEKILLLENSLQDLTQITVDILSRFKFEYNVLERRKDQFLFADDLKAIMVQAQKDTYGDGVDPDTYHPYMWLCKGHYYSAGLNFYNFPYAFGGLFALGLYAQFEKEGEAFVPKYRNLLKSTPTATCEDVALLADIDVSDEAFWKQSLELVKQRIDLYIELTSK